MCRRSDGLTDHARRPGGTPTKRVQRLGVVVPSGAGGGMTATLPERLPVPAPTPRSVTSAPGGGLGRRLRADLRGAYIIWYRDVLRYLRDRTRIVAALGQPVLYLFIFGTGL